MSCGSIDFPLVWISGNGGGRWYAFQHQSSSEYQNNNPNSNYRNLLVSGTTQALKFYMFNPETDSKKIYDAEIRNSHHIDVYQSKFEGRHPPSVRLSNCSDIRWIGVGGNACADAGEAFMSVVNCPDKNKRWCTSRPTHRR